MHADVKRVQAHDAAAASVAPDDQPHVIRGAWTAVFIRIDGRWKIVHEHLSAPPG